MRKIVLFAQILLVRCNSVESVKQFRIILEWLVPNILIFRRPSKLIFYFLENVAIAKTHSLKDTQAT